MRALPAKPDDFINAVWGYYRLHGRHNLPWRQVDATGALDPYAVLVSEIMLQQTQVPRVVPKFEAFMRAFPSVQDLAAATLADVLRLWVGLGYNRRAKFLWQTAGIVAGEHNGRLPQTREALTALPGIGPNTAGAIMTYAFNVPVIFVETNIRSVYIHHFFTGVPQVSDADIIPFIQATVPEDNPREWYWALMDYGTYLKQTVGNTARASQTYAKQSAFHGSRRQIRGEVLKLLAVEVRTAVQLAVLIQDERLESVLEDLTREGFITRNGLRYRLAA
jgi:A/G-specific adenine glycosylase